MKAAVFYGKGDLRIEDVAEPALGPGQLRIRVGYAGICGSDLHTYFAPETNPFLCTEPHPLTGAKMPQILGHELSGTVIEVGAGVVGTSVGDRGAVFPLVASCGSCTSCRRGMPMTCPQMASLGTNTASGGLAEVAVIGAEAFHKVPDNVELQAATLVEPLAVGWHGVVRSNPRAGGSALLVGAGPVGIGAWYAFKAHGVENVLVSEPNAERRAAIAGLGALVIDPVSEDLAAAVHQMTDGGGVDCAVDAAGAQAGFEGALASLTPGGRLCVVAMYERSFDFTPNVLTLTEKEVVGSVGYRPEDFDGIIAAMARGVYDTSSWVEVRELHDVVDAITSLQAGSGAKVLIRMG